VLGNPANRKRTVSLNAKQFRYAFGNLITDEESDALHAAWTIPGPGRPLFEDATANFSKNSPAAVDTANGPRGPLLLTSGSDDHTVPKKVTQEVAKLYAENPSAVTDYLEFEGKGQSRGPRRWAALTSPYARPMGKRVVPVDPPAPFIRFMLVLTALACFLAGGLWVLLFLGMLFFGGIDWHDKVASGMSFQGPVIFGVAALGIFWFVGARSLMDRAAGRRRVPPPPSSSGNDGW